jgi:hypothetical protein
MHNAADGAEYDRSAALRNSGLAKKPPPGRGGGFSICVTPPPKEKITPAMLVAAS